MNNSTKEKYEGIFGNNQKKLAALLELDECTSKWRKFEAILKSMPSDFGGPSIFFHEQAISIAKEGKYFVNDRQKLAEHLKMVYAVLPAWGMHRMGDTDTKIIHYRDFCDNIYDHLERHGDLVRRYKQGALTIENANAKEIADFILSLQVSVSDARLVSSSKTLHHIFPHLIPPIDRAYTIRFMKQEPKFNRGSVPINDENWFAETFINRMQSFLIEDKQRKNRIRKLSENGNEFNTSIPKILDNLIIAFVKLHTKEKKE